MSHWTNLFPHFLGVASGQPTYINFNIPIIGGNQTIQTPGIHQYAYTVNLVKPSGEAGPTRVAAGLFVGSGVQTDFKLTSICRAEIDTGAKEMLGNAGEIFLAAGDLVRIGVWADDQYDPGLIIALPFQCTLTLRRVTGLGT
jgi:hypothetical protein